VLDEEVALVLRQLRHEMPTAPIVRLIEELKNRELIEKREGLNPSTVYRFLRQQGLMRPFEAPPPDRRRFEAELPNDLWQSDSMHGPMVLEGGKQRKTFLFAFLDDHSRLIPHAQFYLSERLDSYLDALRQALLNGGFPASSTSTTGRHSVPKHLAQITASLGIALIHSSPYQPRDGANVNAGSAPCAPSFSLFASPGPQRA